MKYSHKVLTIGCHCDPPKGGVACVLKTYKDNIYRPFRFIVNSKGGLLANVWYLIKSYVECGWLYQTDKQVEIVHIHTASYISFKRSILYINQAKHHGKKVVCHVHGGGFREFRKTCPEFVDKHLRMCDAIVALSETWRKFFAEELGLQNVFVVRNIIENPQPMQVQKDGKFHILFLGLITEAKGIYDLLDAMRNHKEEWHNRIVLHVGGNGKVDQFKQMVTDYQLDDMVVYEGWVSGEKKASLFNLADAYILPSYTEGVPISILESMSYGVPVLSTPVGGIPEVIHSGENGILFQPGDKTAMADAINQLLNNNDLCQQMSERELDEAKDYLPESIAEQLEMLYESIYKQ